jgi:cytochrome c-type biogenesis protein
MKTIEEWLSEGARARIHLVMKQNKILSGRTCWSRRRHQLLVAGCISCMPWTFSSAFVSNHPEIGLVSRIALHKQLERARSHKGTTITSTTSRTWRTLGSRPSSTLAMVNWEDFAFNAQNAASSLATSSLDDPTNLVSSIPIMYFAGLLTSVSPCVWGLLPLTISYISTAAGEREDKDTTLPTLAFASGLALVFCTLGLIAATVGGAVYGNSGNTSIFLPLLSNGICCLMGFQLLGLVQLSLPSLNLASPRPSSSNEPILLDGTGRILSKDKTEPQGSLFRTFLLGGSSALVASPCATPVLTSILGFVANSSDPALGVLLLFFYTLGYSTPLLLVGATGGQALVELKRLGSQDNGGSIVSIVAPWITPFTAGILLWYGTDGLLTTILGDPSLAGMGPII